MGRRRTIGTVAAATLALGTVLAVPRAEAGSPGAEVVFDHTGAFQEYTVPAGIGLLHVVLLGGQGGIYDESTCESGGFGGLVEGDLPVTPGETLRIHVGGAGARYTGDTAAARLGGFNGGGNGQVDTVAGSRGGGGASDIRRAPYGLADRLVVAGGGGGAGNLSGSTTGGAGGAPATAGTDGLGGGAGTQVAGGAPGATLGVVEIAATAGALGQGGDGGRSAGQGAYTGGGGGGGYYGGGGGGGNVSPPGGGGGGGSSLVPAGFTSATGVNGNGGTSCDGVGPRHGRVTVSFSATSTFHPLDPKRLFDTRDSRALAAGDVLPITVAGQLGVPPAGADAVVLNVTVTEPVASGFLTVFPCGAAPPVVSNLNYAVGQTVANLVTVKVGTAGQVCLTSKSTTHVLADVSGWYATPSAPAGARYTPVEPGRLVDTRDTAKLGAGAVLVLPVLGRRGLPASGVSAVTMNVTATEPDASGFLTVYPCGGSVPVVSNVNYERAATVPNLVTVKVGDAGAVCIFTKSGTHVVADVAGWFGPDGSAVGGRFVALTPTRVLDTRDGLGASRLPVPAEGTIALTMLGVGNVPTSGVDAVVLNVTVDQPAAAGFVTVYPCGGAVPTASNLNYTAGQTVPNLVTVKVSADGQVCLFTKARAELIADVSGYVGPSGA